MDTSRILEMLDRLHEVQRGAVAAGVKIFETSVAPDDWYPIRVYLVKAETSAHISFISTQPPSAWEDAFQKVKDFLKP